MTFISNQPAFISYNVLTGSQLEEISICEVNNQFLPRTRNQLETNNLNQTQTQLKCLDNSLYDKRLGCLLYTSVCQTCHLQFQHCKGHLSYIKLDKHFIQYNHENFQMLHQVLRNICLNCNNFIFHHQFITQKTIEKKQQIVGKVQFYEKCQQFYQELYYKIYIDQLMQNQCQFQLQQLLAQKPKPKTIHSLLDQLRNIQIDVETKQMLSNSVIKKFTTQLLHPKNTQIQLCKCCYASSLLGKPLNRNMHQYDIKTLNIQEIAQSLNINFYQYAFKFDIQQTKNYHNLQIGNNFMFPQQVYEIVKEAFEKSFLRNIFSTDQFFIKNVTVLPPKLRPFKITPNNQLEHHVITRLYFQMLRLIQSDTNDIFDDISNITTQNISELQDASQLTQQFNQQTSLEQSNTRENELVIIKQLIMQQLYNKNVSDLDNEFSIKNYLTSKQGLIRQNIEGKRVTNFARSVITPDDNINIDEIGMDKFFAEQLDVQEVVNKYNLQMLMQMILNGSTYPGCHKVIINHQNSIQTENIPKMDIQFRNQLILQIQATYMNLKIIVHRHLLEQDLVLLNRQPTLHKQSILTFKPKIFIKSTNDYTFKVNTAVCDGFGADFDGDEMTLHVLNGYDQQAEAALLCSISNNILKQQDQQVFLKLVQDSIFGLSVIQKKFFNSEQFGQLKQIIELQSDNSQYHELKQQNKIIQVKKQANKKQFTEYQVFHQIQKQFNNGNSHNLQLNSKQVQSSVKSMSIQNQIKIEKQINQQLDKISPIIQYPFELYTGIQLIEHIIKLLLNNDYQEFNYQSNNLTIKNAIIVQGCLSKHNVYEFLLYLNQYEKGKQNCFQLFQTNIVIRFIQYVQKLAHCYIQQYNAVTVSLEDLVCSQKEMQSQQAANTVTNNFNQLFQYSKGSNLNKQQIVDKIGVLPYEKPLTIYSKSLPKDNLYQRVINLRNEKPLIYENYLSSLQYDNFYYSQVQSCQNLLINQMQVSNTGYIQRTLTKCMENILVQYDGSVRDMVSNQYFQQYFNINGQNVNIKSIDLTKNTDTKCQTVNYNFEPKIFIKKEKQQIVHYQKYKYFDEILCSLETKLSEVIHNKMSHKELHKIVLRIFSKIQSYIYPLITNNSINLDIYYSKLCQFTQNLQQFFNLSIFDIYQDCFNYCQLLLNIVKILQVKQTYNSILNNYLLNNKQIKLIPQICKNQKIKYLCKQIDLWHNNYTQQGENIGIITAQSLSQCLTQLVLTQFKQMNDQCNTSQNKLFHVCLGKVSNNSKTQTILIPNEFIEFLQFINSFNSNCRQKLNPLITTIQLAKMQELDYNSYTLIKYKLKIIISKQYNISLFKEFDFDKQFVLQLKCVLQKFYYANCIYLQSDYIHIDKNILVFSFSSSIPLYLEWIETAMQQIYFQTTANQNSTNNIIQINQSGNKIKLQSENLLFQILKIRTNYIMRQNILNNFQFEEIENQIKIFGIESGRYLLHQQITTFFENNFINIHDSYIQLLVDYLTYSGQYCNLKTYMKQSADTFQQASYEYPYNIFQQKSLFYKTIEKIGTSAKQLTGSQKQLFDILIDLTYCTKQNMISHNTLSLQVQNFIKVE